MKLITSNNSRSIPHPSYGCEKIHYWAYKFYRKGLLGNTLSIILKRINQFIFHLNIPPSVKIGERLELAHGGFGIVIHSNTIIGDDAIIFHNVTIGNGGARIPCCVKAWNDLPHGIKHLAVLVCSWATLCSQTSRMDPSGIKRRFFDGSQNRIVG